MKFSIKQKVLIEHLNYAIVLRQIGYDNDEIKQLLENVLVR